MQNLILDCHLQPNAKTTQWVGAHNQAIKIRLQAPACDGKANKALIKFLANEFSAKQNQICIISGLLCRTKRVQISSPYKIPKAVAEYLQETSQ